MTDDEPNLATTAEFQSAQVLTDLRQIRLYVGVCALALVAIAVMVGIIAFGSGIQVKVVGL